MISLRDGCKGLKRIADGCLPNILVLFKRLKTIEKEFEHEPPSNSDE